jgi:hypothetical protein
MDGESVRVFTATHPHVHLPNMRAENEVRIEQQFLMILATKPAKRQA